MVLVITYWKCTTHFFVFILTEWKWKMPKDRAHAFARDIIHCLFFRGLLRCGAHRSVSMHYSRGHPKLNQQFPLHDDLFHLSLIFQQWYISAIHIQLILILTLAVIHNSDSNYPTSSWSTISLANTPSN